MMEALYRAATVAGGPLIDIYLARRKARGKEDAQRFGERLGRPSAPRPQGPVLWVHAASVGELLSLLPLLNLLLARHRDWHALITTGTVTSAALAAERLPVRTQHQYVPVDRPGAVNGFLEHWRPDLVLWMESEFWPNIIASLKKRDIPLVLVNGRISERSFRSWQRFPRFIRSILSAFDLCLGQTDEDARRLRLLGAPNVQCLGNLKSAAPPLPTDASALMEMERLCAERPTWLAASTHAGEELAAWRVHRRLAGRHADLMTIVVPRHVTRGGEIRRELEAAGATVAQRSRSELPGDDVQVYLADTMGELGLFYRLAPVTFIGKSLHGEGGQNPLESARLGSVTLFGPNMQNFESLATAMVNAGAAQRVSSEDELARTVGELLDDETRRGHLAERGMMFATAEAAVLDDVAERLTPYFATESRGVVRARS